MAVVIGHVAFCGLHSTALAHEARTLHCVVAVMWPVFHERVSVKSALVHHHHHAFKDTCFFSTETLRLLHRYDVQGADANTDIPFSCALLRRALKHRMGADRSSQR